MAGHGQSGNGRRRLRRVLLLIPLVLLVAWVIGGWGRSGDTGGDPGPVPSATAVAPGD